MELYSNLSLPDGGACVGEVGAGEAGALAQVEAPLKYHSARAVVLTCARDPGQGPRLVGSLTGAVAS